LVDGFTIDGSQRLDVFDGDHSESEDRFIAIGPIDRGLAVGVYTDPRRRRVASPLRK
jgi:uncharacterized DUF497 family protein